LTDSAFPWAFKRLEAHWVGCPSIGDGFFIGFLLVQIAKAEAVEQYLLSCGPVPKAPLT